MGALALENCLSRGRVSRGRNLVPGLSASADLLAKATISGAKTGNICFRSAPWKIARRAGASREDWVLCLDDLPATTCEFRLRANPQKIVGRDHGFGGGIGDWFATNEIFWITIMKPIKCPGSSCIQIPLTSLSDWLTTCLPGISWVLLGMAIFATLLFDCKCAR
jgi:hypothetical protein